MQSSLTRDILEHLAEGGKIMLEAFFPRGYSYTDPSRRLFSLDRPCRHQFIPTQQRSLSTILSRLRKEGLVARDGARKKTSWSITHKGNRRLQLFASTKSLPKNTYTVPKKDGKLRIVAFDIPERERRKTKKTRLVAGTTFGMRF